MEPRRHLILLSIGIGLVLLAAAAGSLGTTSEALAGPAASAATCTASQKAARVAAVVSYEKRIARDRKAFFRTHKSAKSRALFVRRQQTRLRALKAAAGCTIEKPAPPPAAAPEGLYVAIGDSLAGGVGAGGNYRQTGYVPLLFDWLQANRGLDSLSNRAWDENGGPRGGQNSETIRSGGQLAAALADINGPTDTRVVTLDMGIGDPCLVFSQCPFATNFAATLNDLNDALAHDPGDETLFVLAVYNRNVGLPSEGAEAVRILGTDLRVDCTASGDALGLDDYLTCISASKNASVVDVYEMFQQAGRVYLEDDIHPSVAGHRAIADALIAQCIKICLANP